jgi:hypothetical protein
MAGKTQETLLSEVVQLLRKQNQLSVRDRLRESEEAKRAEKMQAMGEVANEQQAGIISGSEDFQRRFLAGQAKTFTDSATKDTPKGPVQRAILESSNRIANYLENGNTLAKAWRLQDQRDKAENKRERPPSPLALAGSSLQGYRKREKEDGFMADMWDKAKWTFFLATAAAVYLAQEGFNLWHKKALKGLKAVGKWTGSFAKVGERATAFRTSIYKWFGYDKTGKPIEKAKSFKSGTLLNFAGLQTFVGNQLLALKARAYKAVGLGVDGKKLGNTFERGGKGKSAKLGLGAGFGTGFFKTITSNIGKVLSPLIRAGAAVSGWLAGGVGKGLMASIKALGQSPFVKLLSKLLWPVTLIFGMFEGFKAGSAEAEKEGSNWFTVLGEGVGGVLGYIFGGLLDLVKNGAVWLITKGFGLQTDENGNIIGDGIGVTALNIIKEFSFAETIRKLIAMPFHMISNIVGIVGELFTAASNGPGALWEWIQEIPERMSNWVKGMIPEWARDALGIEIGEGGAMSNLSQKQLKKNYGAALRVLLDRSDINPATGKPWEIGRSGKRLGMSALIQKYENAFAESEALQAKFIKGEDARNLAQAIREQQGVGDIPQMPAPQITNINYSSGAYGDMFQNLRTTAMGWNGQSTY